MPMLYLGKRLGNVEHDEVHTHDYGSQGVTRVGIIYPKTHNPEEAKRNRANIERYAKQAMLDAARREAEAAEEKGHAATGE